MARGSALAAVLASFVLIAGCQSADDGSGHVDRDRREAQIACLAHAKDMFPQASSLEIQLQAMDRNDGTAMPGDFRMNGGDFNWTFMTKETSRMLPAKVECVGNLPKRQVGGIVYDGTVRNPASGTIWTY